MAFQARAELCTMHTTRRHQTRKTRADADKWACRNDAFRKDSGLHSVAVVRLFPGLLLELRACCWLRVGPRGAAWRPAGAMGLDVARFPCWGEIRESGARMRVRRIRAAVSSWSRQRRSRRRRMARRVGTTRRGRPSCVSAVRPRSAMSRRAPRLVRGSCCAASGTLGRASRCFLAAGLDFCALSALPGAGALR